jgi:iron-sulfur cluster assembly protein
MGFSKFSKREADSMQDYVNISTAEQASQPQLNQAGLPAPVVSKASAKGIDVTPRALDKIRSGMAKEGISPEEGGLRLGVLGGGCSGLSYSIKFDTRPRERDRVYEFDCVRLFVDPKSFVYLHGMTLDYEQSLMKQGFNFINPNSSRSCGCGSSFS